MRIAITGTGRLAAKLAEGVLRSRHEIVAVVLDGRRTKGYWRSLTWLGARWLAGAATPLGHAARRGLPLIYIDKMDEQELAPLAAAQPDILLVGGFGIILKPPILRLPKIGCVNCHSSLLPRHRGPNPFSAAILAGDAETGVTFHIIDTGIDTGDILAQQAFPIAPADSVLTIYRNSCALAGEMIGPLLDRIESAGLVGTPQDASRATYDKKPTTLDAKLDWRHTAAALDRRCRALSPSPMPRFTCNGNPVYILRAVPRQVDTGSAPPGEVIAERPFVRVATGEGALDVVAGWCNSPVPWFWPAPWNRPRKGDRLE